MTVILQLILGVPSTAYLGDGSPIEPEPQIIDLLDSNAVIQSEAVSGFRQYDRAITALKNGGITMDSQSVDGTEYLAQPVGDVSETIPCIASGTDPVARAAAISRLLEFARSVRQFHSTTYYPFVPYIKVQELGDAGPRYALIKTMSVSVSGASFDAETQDVVINYTREPYWRGIAPGDNPIKWALENYHDLKPSTVAGSGKYTWGDLELYLASNKHLWTTAVDQTQGVNNVANVFATGANIDTKYFIKIPKERIPGDAPALVNLMVLTPDALDHTILHVGRTAVNFPSLIATVGYDDWLFYGVSPYWMAVTSLNALAPRAGILSTQELAGDSTGVPFENNYFAMRIAYSAAVAGADDVVMQWDTQAVPPRYGKWALFARTVVETASGSAADLSFRFEFALDAASSNPSVFYTPSFTTSEQTTPNLHYLGQIQFPFEMPQPFANDLDGTGLNNTPTYTMRIRMLSTNTATTTTVIRFYDMFLVPIDDYVQIVQPPLDGVPLSVPGFGYDNTGYMTRGRNEIAFGWDSGRVGYVAGAELIGGELTLEPGKDNYLFFIRARPLLSGGIISDISTSLTSSVWLNIVPRWQNLRDE